MPLQREDLVKLARAAAAGTHRTLDDGSTETRLPAVRDPASFDPPEWVLEAMESAYARGHRDGAQAEHEHARSSKSWYPMTDSENTERG